MYALITKKIKKKKHANSSHAISLTNKTLLKHSFGLVQNKKDSTMVELTFKQKIKLLK